MAPFKVLLPMLIMAFFKGQSCQNQKKPAIAGYFQLLAPADTVLVTLEVPEERSWRQSIDPRLLLAELDSALLRRMIYPLDTFDTEAYGHWCMPVDVENEICLLEIRQSWYAFRYLLLLSEKEGRFTGLIPAAQFYGGDGSQIRTESRLFDWGKAEGPKMLLRQAYHTVRFTDGEAADLYEESAQLFQWMGKGFREISLQDSGRWRKAYPVKW